MIREVLITVSNIILLFEGKENKLCVCSTQLHMLFVSFTCAHLKYEVRQGRVQQVAAEAGGGEVHGEPATAPRSCHRRRPPL